ncbi:MAG: metal-dependent transcriptional regulator, partial [Candidatus Marinimicrobia bacterium]|nr:metal-dependent transcriptional regulator [Candidatus Neomarinimicrobiota bacterium]
MITSTVEDYLATIYRVTSVNQKSTTTIIADKMRVSRGTVTSMFKKLAESELITHVLYKGVSLTATGEKIALEIIRHHRLLELYLQNTMGVPWDKVHEEADKLEHILSEEIEDRIDTLLNNPTNDPHGAPIPTKEGYVSNDNFRRLSQAKEGEKLVIKRVDEEDSEKLVYLADKGLYPDTLLKVTNVEPFNGPITIEIDNSEIIVGNKIADSVFVDEV